MNIQIFGTKKCKDTGKAQRWFNERSIKFQLIDLRQKGMAAGEIRSVAASVGGIEELIDREGNRYRDRGLRAAAPTGPRVEKALIEDSRLLRTPIVRNGKSATIGFSPDVWSDWE